MIMSGDLTVIVSLYNPTEKELNNVAAYAGLFHRCVVVDDSSTDNYQFIYDYFVEHNAHNICIICNETNIGLSRSLNKGICAALTDNPKWIILMDQDSIMGHEMIEAYIRFINNNDVTNIACIAPQYNYDRHKRHEYDGVKQIKWTMTSGMCINCDSLSQIGLFDEKLFIDGLDMEWSLRARSLGFAIWEIGNAVMQHHPAETKSLSVFGKIILLYGWAEPERYYYQYKANMYIFHKYRELATVKSQMIKMIKPLLLFKDKRRYITAYKRAVSDYNEMKKHL